MSDLISRQAALKKFTYSYKGERIPDYDCDNFPTQISFVDARKVIRELPSVEPESKWIPVSERLPEPNRLVLCYITTGATETYFLALWNDTINAWEEGIGGYRLLENDLGYEVIAWMPLPEPYKSESEEV